MTISTKTAKNILDQIELWCKSEGVGVAQVVRLLDIISHVDGNQSFRESIGMLNINLRARAKNS